VLGRLPQFEPVVSERTWHSDDASGHWVETRARDKSSGELESAPAHVRGAWGMAWTQSWSSDRALVVYVHDAGRDARIAIRNREPLNGLVETPDNRVWQRLHLEPTTDTPAMIDLPAAEHLMVSLWRR
jgi:hypothetical protein